MGLPEQSDTGILNTYPTMQIWKTHPSILLVIAIYRSIGNLESYLFQLRSFTDPVALYCFLVVLIHISICPSKAALKLTLKNVHRWALCYLRNQYTMFVQGVTCIGSCDCPGGIRCNIKSCARHVRMYVISRELAGPFCAWYFTAAS